MNPYEYLSLLIKEEEDYLMHDGVAHDHNPPGRGSGRYGWGEGERILQRAYDLQSRVTKLRKSGISDKEIAKMLGFYTLDKKGNPVKDENGEYEGNIKRLQANYQFAKNEVRQDKVRQAQELSQKINPETGKPYTNTEIGKIMNMNESSVRNLLRNETAAENTDRTVEVYNKLKEMVDRGEYINVGRGVENVLDTTRDRVDKALIMLEQEGYHVDDVYTPQMTSSTHNLTTIHTLYPPDVEYSTVVKNRADIKSVEGETDDRAATLKGMQYPTEVELSRVGVKYKEDGGDQKDGIIELRAIRGEDGKLYPACPDLDLGNAKYAQVRIAVDGDPEGLGKRYIKGMAVYNEDLPEGTDILVNSNKSTIQGLDKALKKMETVKLPDGTEVINEHDPFGSTVFQADYAPGKLSALNIVGDVNGVDQHKEGAWNDWSRNMPAQFLSKQSEQLVKQQLNLKVMEKQAEYDQIMQINNPVVKKQMLLDFADGCDGSAVDLKAAPIAGQRTQVLLSVPSLSDNEIYAPRFETGQTVALVRFPHGGPFEIPILKVNNNNVEANKFMKDAKDAVGINKHTADILSGADCDGDTAIVIPMSRKNSQGEFERAVNIKGIGNGATLLPNMEGFDPKDAYKSAPGVKPMTKQQKQTQMGIATNLIMDMQSKGCEDPEKLARAVKYSMVVIDAYKHKLDWRQAEKDFEIKELKNEYQLDSEGHTGAATLMTRAKSPRDVEQRQNWDPDRVVKDKDGKIVYQAIDPVTGEKNYLLAPHRFYEKTAPVKVKDDNGKYVKDENGDYVYETWPNGKVKQVPTGEIGVRTQKVARMTLVKDANELLSDNPNNKELAYANFANKMKAMANEARKEAIAQPKIKKNPQAVKEYAEEVASLNVKLNEAKKNSYREKQAQLLAGQIVNARKQDNPDMDKDDLKKARGNAINYAREATGATKKAVEFTEREWEAVNKGAVSQTTFEQLLSNSKKESYMSYALPRSSRVSQATANYITALRDAGWTREEIVRAGYASQDAIDAVEAGHID